MCKKAHTLQKEPVIFTRETCQLGRHFNPVFFTGKNCFEKKLQIFSVFVQKKKLF